MPVLNLLKISESLLILKHNRRHLKQKYFTILKLNLCPLKKIRSHQEEFYFYK